MNKMHNDPFTVNLPHLDLHGETYETTPYVLNSFIKDNYILNNKKIVIIHGIGGNVLKKRCYEILKKNKYVKHFVLDSNNIGQTIIELM